VAAFRSWSVVALLAAGTLWCLPAAAAPRSRGLCATATAEQEGPYLAVLSAFPAELVPLVDAAEIETTVEVEGRQYHLGRLEGVRVVLGMLGIGEVNAQTTTEAVIANFEVAGLVVTGVAGSHHRIGDVVLATEWVEPDRARVFRANPALLALARRAPGKLPAPLEKCTVPPRTVGATLVCMPHDPVVVFGGRGQTDGGDAALACLPGDHDVFGCELPRPTAAVAAAAPAEASPDLQDQETAAAARIAIRRRVPFVAVRAVSDGAGDPLGDREFPIQFFDYYRLAARNAALVTRAVVAEVGRLAQDTAARRVCQLLAKRRWRPAAARILGP